ncbi:MAG: hypothetical protein GKR96_05675 [Gammaproteobacteria bacterium]|nr:hypothetical protein [Gammaproteobacteria bacterium]
MSVQPSITDPSNALEKLAVFVNETNFCLTEKSHISVRDALIDTLGCIIVGMKEDNTKKAIDAVQEWGKGTAPLFGYNLSLSPPWAAFVNATAGHSLDFDDWESPGNTHLSVVLFPSLLAVASTRPTSGRELVDAYVAGFEVVARLGEAMNFDHYSMGWHSTATLGAIGAAASVARLLGLDARKTANAMSIAASQASGYTCQFGSDAKPLQAGFAAKAGVVAAKLAESGLCGQTHVFDADNGLKALMSHGDSDRFNRPFINFPGGELAIEQYGLAVKAYPCCGYTHRLIDCAVMIQKIPGFDPVEINTVTASLPDFHSNILPFQQPESRTEALFSVPFCVALTLLGRAPTLVEINQESWTDPMVMELIKKVEKVSRTPNNTALNYDPDDPDWVKVVMKDGTVHQTENTFPLGSPENKMTSDQIMEKFVLNAATATNHSDKLHIDMSGLRQWSCLPDVNDLLSDLSSDVVIASV